VSEARDISTPSPPPSIWGEFDHQTVIFDLERAQENCRAYAKYERLAKQDKLLNGFLREVQNFVFA
jgi:hypothetical protein